MCGHYVLDFGLLDPYNLMCGHYMLDDGLCFRFMRI